jgi:hypothetical protein
MTFSERNKSITCWEIWYLHIYKHYIHVFVWVFHTMRPVTALSDLYEIKD